jgi:hypothetical protein
VRIAHAAVDDRADAAAHLHAECEQLAEAADALRRPSPDRDLAVADALDRAHLLGVTETFVRRHLPADRVGPAADAHRFVRERPQVVREHLFAPADAVQQVGQRGGIHLQEALADTVRIVAMFVGHDRIPPRSGPFDRPWILCAATRDPEPPARRPDVRCSHARPGTREHRDDHRARDRRRRCRDGSAASAHFLGDRASGIRRIDGRPFPRDPAPSTRCFIVE